MKRQFMVRIVRDDEDYADVVVDAENEERAKEVALAIVKANPDMWFGGITPPQYHVDESSDVEELDGTEYISANEVRP